MWNHILMSLICFSSRLHINLFTLPNATRHAVAAVSFHSAIDGNVGMKSSCLQINSSSHFRQSASVRLKLTYRFQVSELIS